MRDASRPVEILVINGFDDDHLRTDERLRLARLANDVTIVTGADAGLRHLLEARDDDRLPGLVVADLDLTDAEQLLDGVRRATDLTDLPILVLDDGTVDLDVRSGSTTVRVPRPASFSDLMAAVHSFERFRFDIEMREFTMRYETWMWLHHAGADLDLADAEPESATVPVT
ncbi:MAG: hypothetical protein AAFZ07_06800 [Actinomycetota bacterium]